MENKKPALSKRDHILLCVAMAMGLVFFMKTIHSKKRKEIVELNRTIAIEVADYEKSKALYGELASRKPASIEKNESRELYERLIKTNSNFSNVIEALAKGDGNSTFLVNKIITEKQEQMNGYTKSLFDIDVEAPFLSIGKFLEGLETSPLLTEIQGVEVIRVGNELTRCTAKIKLASYVVKK